MYSPRLSDPDFLQRSENYWFYGIVLSCICYGLNLALSLSCIRLLSPQFRFTSKKDRALYVGDTTSEWRKVYPLAEVFLLLGFATASIIPVILVGKGTFDGTMSLSGSPAQYLVRHVFQNVTTLRVAYVTSILCHIFTSIHRVSYDLLLPSTCHSQFFLFRSERIVLFSHLRWEPFVREVLCGMGR